MLLVELSQNKNLNLNIYEFQRRESACEGAKEFD